MFPYKVQNPVSKERVTISNDADIAKMFKSFLAHRGSVFYTFCKLTICPNRLRDPWADGVVSRYFYCERTGVQPYSGAYNDQPTYWLDISRFIQSTIDEIRAYKVSIDGQ